MKAELVLGNLKRERDALDSKLERLGTALLKEWQDEDQEYLCGQQYNAMCLYAHILDERIADIEYKLEKKKAESKIQPHETSHDENIFKEKIDFDSCKEYLKNQGYCKDEDHDDCCDERDLPDIIVEIITDVFGKDIY